MERVLAQVGAAGKIESAFGKAGRFKARFPRGTHIKVKKYSVTCLESACITLASNAISEGIVS